MFIYQGGKATGDKATAEETGGNKSIIVKYHGHYLVLTEHWLRQMKASPSVYFLENTFIT